MWLCRLFGHKMVHAIYPALFGSHSRVYCKRCGSGPDIKQAPAKPDTGEEGQPGETE